MITVFTPTFNRGYIINSLYQSLKRQSCKEFEWIVVDDGSTDNTEELFRKWKNEKNDFSIQYKKVTNGGKHRAVNIGVKMANSDAFFIVDSDDYLLEEAIEQINYYFEMICNDSEYAGIAGLKGYSEKEPVGGWGKYTGEYIDATNLERAYYGLLKDKAEVYKTSILKKYPFPEFKDENFVTEGIVFNKIAKDGYKIRWFKKIIYICKYLDDGLTRCGYFRSIKNPRGYMAYLELMEEIYGANYSSKWRFGFYFVLRSKRDMEETKKIMQVSSQEAMFLEEKYEKMIRDMNLYFLRYNIKNVAIYGFGNVGNAFWAIRSALNVDIKYALDKRIMNKKELPIHMPNEVLEPVDAIIITLKDYEPAIEAELNRICKTVIYWKDISFKYWIKNELEKAD